MNSWKLKGALLLSSALIGSALVAGHSRAVTGERNVEELFDPAQVRAALCGKAGQRTKPTLAQALQVALVTPAYAAAESAEGPPLYDGLGDLT